MPVVIPPSIAQTFGTDDVEGGVYQFLVNSGLVTAVVGSRIFPLRIPAKTTLPALIYQKISGPSEHSKDGDMQLGNPRFQFTCWASTYDDAKTVIKAVRAALVGFTNGAAMGGVTVAQIIVDSDNDLHDPETLEFGASLDAIIWYT